MMGNLSVALNLKPYAGDVILFATLSTASQKMSQLTFLTRPTLFILLKN